MLTDFELQETEHVNGMLGRYHIINDDNITCPYLTHNR